MSGFKIFSLVLKRCARLWWTVVLFALLFGIIFFINFVRGDMLDALYDDIITNADYEDLVLSGTYSPGIDFGEADPGIYYINSGETYGVTLESGGASVEIGRTASGLNVLRAKSGWDSLLSSGSFSDGDEYIWIYETYADTYGIYEGQTATVHGDKTKTYTVAGTYGISVSSKLLCGYTPAFITCNPCNETKAVSIICDSDDIYPLYLKGILAELAGEDGITELCEGYRTAEIGFAAVFALFSVLAALLCAKITDFVLAAVSGQTFALRICGFTRLRTWAVYFGFFAIAGIISAAAGTGLFYLLKTVTEMLSSNIMGMEFGATEIWGTLVCGTIAYLALAAAVCALRTIPSPFARGRAET